MGMPKMTGSLMLKTPMGADISATTRHSRRLEKIMMAMMRPRVMPAPENMEKHSNEALVHR